MQPIKMEEKLKQARFALMTMFEVLEKDILFMNNRKQNNVHARMYYNYYLWKKFNLRTQIKPFAETRSDYNLKTGNST